MIRCLLCTVLCMVLAGCYFLEGGGSPLNSRVVERNLLSNSECFQYPCWEEWIPGETHLNAVETSGRFSEPSPWFDRGYVVLHGIGDDADIDAIFDIDTQVLKSLFFTGPYELTMEAVISVLGMPDYIQSSYSRPMTIDEPLIGQLLFYYSQRGYQFQFFIQATDSQSGNTVQICPLGSEIVQQMRMYKRGDIQDILEFSYMDVDESNVGTMMSGLEQWSGYNCIDVQR